MFWPSRTSRPGGVWGGPSETPASRAMDCSHCYHQADVITEPTPADSETSSFHRQSDWTELIPVKPYTPHQPHMPCTLISYADWTQYYYAPWHSVCTNSYRALLQRCMCTVIIIVFNSCSLYSIIFNIYCSLPELSPLYMCVAYIYIQNLYFIYIHELIHLSSILSRCSLHPRLSSPVYLCSLYCDNKDIWFKLVTCLLFISCAVGCCITTAKKNVWHGRLWYVQDMDKQEEEEKQESSKNLMWFFGAQDISPCMHLHGFIWLEKHGFNITHF